MLLTAIFLISCGDKKEEKEQITLEAPETTETRATTSDSNEKMVEISLTGDDQMRFNKKEIRVRAGQTVKLTLEHVGKMEKNVMGHNFVLLSQGTDINQFGQQAVQAANNDYIPQGSSNVIAHTKMIGGGESVTIEFEAPAAGTYDFICSFPGHYAVMRGKFIVE
ncbi:azurin [Antarcticibacterium arcticum]|uniref:Azurin n=2 Tax=Antarcticibacterium arcticum TaxID=2585771 RepID=A0A5B8YM89_9FLAO|nr:azurin [Antarcticibacterium arcticum]